MHIWSSSIGYLGNALGHRFATKGHNSKVRELSRMTPSASWQGVEDTRRGTDMRCLANCRLSISANQVHQLVCHDLHSGIQHDVKSPKRRGLSAA